MGVTKDMIGKRIIFKKIEDCSEEELTINFRMALDMAKGGIIRKVDTSDNTFKIDDSFFWFAGEWIKEIK